VSDDAIIRAVGLTKRFGDFTAVDQLTFEVRRGSIFAFLGANGSGKSTTIRMLIGLLEPTAGTIDVDGIDVVRTPREVRDEIGYMGQRVSLYQGLSLRENLDFYAGLYGLAGVELERRWGSLRERFALRDVEHELAADLPAGIRQRAGLALSTLHHPRVLFLDEPTAGVDIENRLRFWELIQDEADAGVTVFVTTHFLEEVDYCDWVCFIDAGRLIANAPPDDIRARHAAGYAITLELAPACRDAAAAALAAPARSITPTPAGLDVRTTRLDDVLLTELARLRTAYPTSAVHIAEPSMTDVLRDLMLAAARPQSDAGRSGETMAGAAAPAPVLATPVVPPSPTAERAPGPRSAAAPHERRTRSHGAVAAWQRLRTLMQREIRTTLRDRFTVTIMIAVPLAALLAFGYTLSTDVHHLALGVHDASGSAASRRLIAELAANGTFTPRRFATRQAIDRALVAGDISVAVVIPPDFDRHLGGAASAADPPQIQVLYDGGETVVAGNAEAFLRGLVGATGLSLVTGDAPSRRGVVSDGNADGSAASHRTSAGAHAGVGIVAHALFNPRLDGAPFMVAGTFGFVLTFLTTLITAVSIVNERVSGTFEQLRVTPATAAEIVLGKILPLGAVFAFDVALMVVTAGVVLGVWPAGNLLFFFVVSAFYVLVSLAMGLYLSATSATAAAAVQKTVLSSVPLIFLGGFAFPVRNMPLFFRIASEMLPAAHYIRISRAIYLRGEGPLPLLPEVLLLFLFGTVLMAIAFRAVAART
jgi:ribosome-dependent ATPase